ncbi:MAG: hypothetical protein N2Z65_03585 [Clostridiales bacterium]|nr:hypothetical protein [Clostridiales bacterium]
MSSLIWAFVILACSMAAPESYGKLLPILGAGAVLHILMLDGSPITKEQDHPEDHHKNQP